MIDCPKCGFENLSDVFECARCGIIFERFHAQRERRHDDHDAIFEAPSEEPAVRGTLYTPPDPSLVVEPEIAAYPLELDDSGKQALMVGAVLGILGYIIPIFRWILQYMITLVHEMGHAGMSWFLGFPAIPAFDFVYGGGVTMHQDRSYMLCLAIMVLISVPFAKGYKQPRVVGTWIVVLGIWCLMAFTGFTEVLFLTMGHGAEVLWVILCVYRGLSGWGVVQAMERPLYIMLAVNTWIHGLVFGAKLMVSESFKASYGAAKGGGNWMDFDRLGFQTGLGLELVAAIYFMTMLIALPFAIWLFAYQPFWQGQFQRFKDWLEAA